MDALILARVPAVSVFFVLLVTTVALLCYKGKSSRRTVTFVVVSLSALISLVLALYLLVEHQSSARSVSRTSHPPLAAARNNDQSEQVALSNEELWKRLTESRINLESETNDEEEATSENEGLHDDQEGADAPVEVKPAKRPDWVENPPKRMGDVYRRVVSSELYSTVDECHMHLEAQLREAVRDRVQTLVADSEISSTLVPEPDSFGIGLDYIMREICRDEFIETESASFGEMKRVHVLMEFSPAVEKNLRAAWQRHERMHRLGVVGAFSGLALSLLAGVYGLLKFDTWTRGYYTKQLLLGVPATIIAIVVLLSLLVT